MTDKQLIIDANTGESVEVPLTTEQIAEREAWEAGSYDREVAAVSEARFNAYKAPGGSDAIFMKFQRGLATEQEWLDAVEAINEANPYPAKAV